jgi:uncharacterized membrane protein
MSSFVEWHPVAVHFPLALVTTGALALTASRMSALSRHGATLATVGTWNLCLGAVGALAALATGLAAVVDLDLGPAARAAVALHVKWAIFTAVALLLLAAWRGAGGAQDARPSRAFLAALWLVTAALIVTGYRGGENVYRHGVGVTPGAQRTGNAVQPRGELHGVAPHAVHHSLGISPV